jgi:hypothetical protein
VRTVPGIEATTKPITTVTVEEKVRQRYEEIVKELIHQVKKQVMSYMLAGLKQAHRYFGADLDVDISMKEFDKGVDFIVHVTISESTLKKILDELKAEMEDLEVKKRVLQKLAKFV